MEKYDVFISYRRSANDIDIHGNIVEDFYKNFHKKIKKKGYQTFLDVEELNPGDQWSDRIVQAVESAKILLLIITPGWMDEFEKRKDEEDILALEINTALKTNSLIFPILISDKKAEAKVPTSEELERWGVKGFSFQTTQYTEIRFEKLWGKHLKYEAKKTAKKCLEILFQKSLQSMVIHPDQILDKLYANCAKLKPEHEHLYEERKGVDDRLKENLSDMGKRSPRTILITGKSNSGKTRAVANCLQTLSSNKEIILINRYTDIENVRIPKMGCTKRIFVFDDLYKTYLKHGGKLFEIWDKVNSRYEVIATCTSFEIEIMKEKDSHLYGFLDNERFHIQIQDLQEDFKIKIKPRIERDFNENALTIGDLLGVEYPWDEFKEKIYCKSACVLYALKLLAFIKKNSHPKLKDLSHILNQEAYLKNRASQLGISMEKLGSFDSEHIIKRLKELACFGFLEMEDVDGEVVVKLDTDYRECHCETIAFGLAENFVLNYYLINKNLARLIKRTSNKERQKKLFNKRISKEDQIEWVFNSMLQVEETFDSAKQFYLKEIKGEAISKASILDTLATKAENIKDAVFIREEISLEKDSFNTSEYADLLKIYNSMLKGYGMKLSDCQTIISWMQENQIPLLEKTHGLLIKKMCNQEPEKVFDYYERELKINGKLAKSYQIARTMVLDVNLSVDQKKKLLLNYRDASITEDHDPVQIPILFNYALRDVDDSLAFYVWGEEELQIELDEYTCMNLIKSNKQNVWLHKYVREKFKKNRRFKNELIKQADNFRSALLMFEELSKPDDYSFNFLLEKVDSKKKYEVVYDKMKNFKRKEQLSRSVDTLVKLKIEMREGVSSILDELFLPINSQSSFTINHVIVNRLLKESKDPLSFLNQIRTQCAYTIHPDNFCFLIRLLRDERKVRYYIKEYKESFGLDFHLYKAVLSNYCLNDLHGEYFNTYLGELRSATIPEHQTEIVSFYLNGLGQRNLPDKIEHLDVLLEKYQISFMPNSRFIETLHHSHQKNEIIAYCLENAIPYSKKMVNELLYKDLMKGRFQNPMEWQAFLKKNDLDHSGIQFTCEQYKRAIKYRRTQRYSKEQVKELFQIIHQFNKTTPEVSFYEEWIEFCHSYQDAKKVLEFYPVDDHQLHNATLKKINDYHEFFEAYEQIKLRFLNFKKMINEINLSATFNIWYEKEKENQWDCTSVREAEEVHFKWREDSCRLSYINRKERDFDEAIEATKKSSARNVINYNSIFSKLSGNHWIEQQKAQKLYNVIKEERDISANKLTYQRVLEHIRSGQEAVKIYKDMHSDLLSISSESYKYICQGTKQNRYGMIRMRYESLHDIQYVILMSVVHGIHEAIRTKKYRDLNRELNQLLSILWKKLQSKSNDAIWNIEVPSDLLSIDQSIPIFVLKPYHMPEEINFQACLDELSEKLYIVTLIKKRDFVQR